MIHLKRIKSASRETESFLCVVTFEYANGPFDVASKPCEHDAALRLFDWHVRLNASSPHSLKARVYSEADYATHCRVPS